MCATWALFNFEAARASCRKRESRCWSRATSAERILSATARSSREADPLHKLLKARIVAQRFHEGIYFHEADKLISFVERFVEGGKGPILVTCFRVKARHVVSSHLHRRMFHSHRTQKSLPAAFGKTLSD